jgi:long-subunit fatty acid transport protein
LLSADSAIITYQMKTTKIILILAVFTFSFQTTIYSQTSPMGGQFLKMGPGPRALAMGEAFSGVADDISAIYWNPAGLANLKKNELSIQHMLYLFDIQHTNILYGSKLSDKGGYGIQWEFLWSPDEIRDTSGNSSGSFTSYYSKLVFGYAYKTSDKISLGFDAEALICYPADIQTANFGINLGGLFRGDNYNIGFVFQNIQNDLLLFGENGPLNLKYTPEPMPEIFRLGIGYMASKDLTMAIDYNKANDNNGYMNMGMEYSIKDAFAVRLGYKLPIKSDELGDLAGFTCGFGLNKNNFGFDFAITPQGDLGTTYSASLKFFFSERK